MKDEKYIDNDSTIWYYKNNKLHREDGPAIIWKDNEKSWWINGELHRENGPAIEQSDGNKWWYYYGNCAKNKKQFYNSKWRKNILMDLI